MIRKLLPHALFIMAVMFIVLNILDSYNPAMGFLTSSLSKWMLVSFCGFALFIAIYMIVNNRRRE
jgi:hypothetical protein